MISLIGKTPGKVVIFGVEPGTIDWGEELTPEVKNKLPILIDHIKNEIKLSIKELKNLETEETNG